MSDKNEAEKFFDAAKEDKNGEFVRVIFYSDADYSEFDPTADAKLAKLGNWCWNLNTTPCFSKWPTQELRR